MATTIRQPRGDISVIDGGPCFVCGSADLASRAQPRRRYAELTTLFKTLVMTTNLRKKLGCSSSAYADFSTNVESCATCLTTIRDVYDLRQEIVTLQTQLDELLEGARTKLGTNGEKKAGSRNLRNSKQSVQIDSAITFTDEDFVEIKEECDDLFYMDAEIIPDSENLMEMDPLRSDANDDNNSPNDEIQPGDDDDRDPDYDPTTTPSEDILFNLSVTQKNKPCLQYQNYSYISYKKRGVREYWKCRTTKCPGRLIKSINDAMNDAIISQEHTCTRSAIEVQVETLREDLKTEALKNPLLAPSKIISAVKAKYSADVVHAIPRDSTLLRHIRRVRATFGFGNDPKSRQEIG